LDVEAGFIKYDSIYLNSNKNSITFSKEPYDILIAYVPNEPTIQPKMQTNCLAANILILNKKYYTSLISFHYGEDSIKYKFENNIELSLMKSQSDHVIYHFKTPSINITLPMDIRFNSLKRYFLSISNTKCCEFDKLINFYRICTGNAIMSEIMKPPINVVAYPINTAVQDIR
jgi:hypothetical protein